MVQLRWSKFWDHPCRECAGSRHRHRVVCHDNHRHNPQDIPHHRGGRDLLRRVDEDASSRGPQPLSGPLPARPRLPVRGRRPRRLDGWLLSLVGMSADWRTHETVGAAASDARGGDGARSPATWLAYNGRGSGRLYVEPRYGATAVEVRWPRGRGETQWRQIKRDKRSASIKASDTQTFLVPKTAPQTPGTLNEIQIRFSPMRFTAIAAQGVVATR